MFASKIPVTGRYDRCSAHKVTLPDATTVSNHRVSLPDFKRAMKTFAGTNGTFLHFCHDRTNATGDVLYRLVQDGYECNLKGSGHVGSYGALDQMENVSFSRFPEMFRNTKLSRSVYFDSSYGLFRLLLFSNKCRGETWFLQTKYKGFVSTIAFLELDRSRQ